MESNVEEILLDGLVLRHSVEFTSGLGGVMKGFIETLHRGLEISRLLT